MEFVTRALLLVLARNDLTSTAGDVARAFVAGQVFDLLAAGWLLLPFVAYLALTSERWFHRPVNRAGIHAGFFIAIAAAVLVFATELFFFDEFTSRFNFVAVDYLIFPKEVITNIDESYPLVPVLVAIACAAGVVVWLIRKPIARAFATTTSTGRRLTILGAYSAVLAALTLTVHPSLAQVSDDRELNEIATNGYYSWWMAFMGQDAPYNGLYATLPRADEWRRMRRLVAEPETDTAAMREGSTLRPIVATTPERRMNVVLILEESLGSVHVGALHPRDTSLTPHFDSLITEGTLLANAYSTGNRTIRALEATTTSLPPLPGISIVRRPASTDLFTLPEVLKHRGYSTAFIYGGRALFDGMGQYMRANGMERVVEQKDFADSLFSTAWGVADEYIFDKTLQQMDSVSAAGRPFFFQVLTVSNHKPYTYPGGRIAADPNQHYRTNAVQYADWALGRFMRQARTQPWFAHTLFVLMGDHGPRVYGASEIPLASYEIPILFYAPGFMDAGRRITTLVSSLDLPPTILARLGLSYESKFYGRDAFDTPASEGRALMTHNSSIAMLKGDEVAVLGLRESRELYRYDRTAGRLRRLATPDAAGTELIDDAIAYYNSADELYRTGGYTFAKSSEANVATLHRARRGMTERGSAKKGPTKDVNAAPAAVAR